MWMAPTAHTCPGNMPGAGAARPLTHRLPERRPEGLSTYL